jgi:hypothetical protein
LGGKSRRRVLRNEAVLGQGLRFGAQLEFWAELDVIAGVRGFTGQHHSQVCHNAPTWKTTKQWLIHCLWPIDSIKATLA